jgi:hypothetical protein
MATGAGGTPFAPSHPHDSKPTPRRSEPEVYMTMEKKLRSIELEVDESSIGEGGGSSLRHYLLAYCARIDVEITIFLLMLIFIFVTNAIFTRVSCTARSLGNPLMLDLAFCCAVEPGRMRDGSP